MSLAQSLHRAIQLNSNPKSSLTKVSYIKHDDSVLLAKT
jgi:hypothetical protein